MAAAAASRSAQESERKEAIQKQRLEEKEKKAGSRQIAAEKKRLSDEEDSAEKRLRELEYEFRSVIYTLRARPMGHDRYGNKVWWMDGLGSAAPLISDSGKITWGTGRIYVQGPDSTEVELLRLAAGGAVMVHWYGEQGRQKDVEEEAEVKMEVIEERRTREEGEGRLEAGEWGVYDTPEQVSTVPFSSKCLRIPETRRRSHHRILLIVEVLRFKANIRSYQTLYHTSTPGVSENYLS